MLLDSIHNYKPSEALVEEERNKKLNTYDKGFLLLIALYFVSGLIISTFTSTWFTALKFSLPLIIVYLGCYYFVPKRNFARFVLIFILFLFQVQFAYQLSGAFYSQFYYFLTLTALIVFQRTRFIITYFLFIHIFYASIAFFIFNGLLTNITISNNSYIDLFFNPKETLNLLVLTTLHLAICVFLVNYFKKQTYSSIKQKLFIENELNIDHSISLAKEIASGNYNVNIDAGNDELTNHLVKIKENILEFKETESIQTWKNTGIRTISELLLTINSLDKLCSKVLREIVTYLKSQYGAIFVVESVDNEEKLVLKSSYAGSKRQKKTLSLDISEGLVGEAVIRKEMNLIKEVPESYHLIGSGLGEASPKNVLILPLIAKNETIGVLEIASFKDFLDYELDFLQQVSSNLAVSILSLKADKDIEAVTRG